MTDNNHPITPPPALVEQWRTAPEYTTGKEMFTMVSLSTRRLQEVATQAARWGADQELEACCDSLQELWAPSDWITSLRAARRPNPPSLKELALEALDQADKGLNESEWQQRSDTIRRALESLPN